MHTSRLSTPRRVRPLGFEAMGLALLCAAAAPARVQAQVQPLTLGAAADAVMDADPSLAAARARAGGAAADVDRATAARLPSLSLDGSLTRFQEPMVVAPLHSFDPTTPPRFDETLVQGAVRLRYTAFDGGARGARIRASRAREAATDAGVVSRRMEVLDALAAAYLRVLTTRARLDAAEARREALDAERDRAQRTVDAGTAARVEVLRASAALEEARAEEAAARSQARLAAQDLARMMDVPVSDIEGRALSAVDVDDQAALATDVPSLHPELAGAREAARAAEARVGEERASWLPRLDLSGAVLDYGTASGGHVAEWQAGVMLSWPVFTGGARGATVRRAEADMMAARSELEATERAVDARLDAARAGIEEADARTQALLASVEQWQEVARIEALALDTGAGVQSDRLAAEASLFRARAGLAQARHDRVLARIRLARALGILDRDWLDQNLEMDR